MMRDSLNYYLYVYTLAAEVAVRTLHRFGRNVLSVIKQVTYIFNARSERQMVCRGVLSLAICWLSYVTHRNCTSRFVFEMLMLRRVRNVFFFYVCAF